MRTLSPKSLGMALMVLVSALWSASAQTNAPTVTDTNAPAWVVDHSLTAEVVRVNPRARFVVLSFPLLRMPHVGQRFTVWRTNGVVGELRVSGPRRDETIVADIISGECRRGDEVRERREDQPGTNAPARAGEEVGAGR